MRELRKYIDTLIALLSLAFAGLTYSEIGPGELVAGIGPIAQAFTYLATGFLIGWCGCRLRYNYYPRRASSSHSDERSFDDFASNFASVPFEMKAFLKTILLHGAAYRHSGEVFEFFEQMRYLDQFLVTRTIRNNITKYVFNSNAETLFGEHPELLEEVSEADLAPYRMNGTEGDPCYRHSTYFDWWFYDRIN